MLLAISDSSLCAFQYYSIPENLWLCSLCILPGLPPLRCMLDAFHSSFTSLNLFHFSHFSTSPSGVCLNSVPLNSLNSYSPNFKFQWLYLFLEVAFASFLKLHVFVSYFPIFVQVFYFLFYLINNFTHIT